MVYKRQRQCLYAIASLYFSANGLFIQNTTYYSQQRFTVWGVLTDWHELMVPDGILQPSVAQWTVGQWNCTIVRAV